MSNLTDLVATSLGMMAAQAGTNYAYYIKSNNLYGARDRKTQKLIGKLNKIEKSLSVLDSNLGEEDLLFSSETYGWLRESHRKLGEALSEEDKQFKWPSLKKEISILGLRGTLGYLVARAAYILAFRTINANKDVLGNFLRLGIVIEEGWKNLGYVERVCQSEKREQKEFQAQIDFLEGVLMSYVRGRLSYQEVIDARIKYFPAEKLVQKAPKTKQQDNALPQKKSYSPKEYFEMKKREEREGAFRLRKRKRLEQNPQPVLLDETKKPEVLFSIGDSLSKLYENGNSQLSGYGIVSLIDTARAKIESLAYERLDNHGNLNIEHSSKNASLIRDKDQGIHLLKRLKVRYNLPENARVYKIRPVGSLRAIFTIENSKITLLEILSHDQYEEWMKPI